jgi:hypothetical protein
MYIYTMKYLKRFNESLDYSCVRIDSSEYYFDNKYMAVYMRDSVIKTSKSVISRIEDYIHHYEKHWSLFNIKWDRDSYIQFKNFKYKRPSAKNKKYNGITVEIRENEDLWIFIRIWIYGLDELFFKCDQESGLSEVIDEFKIWWDNNKSKAILENI